MTGITEDRAEVLRDMIGNAEGSVPFLYKDSQGNITIGKGHLLAGTAQACAVLSRFPASQVVQDWERVASAPKGQHLSVYANITSCRMTAAEIDALESLDISAKWEEIRSRFPWFDAAPWPAQQAILDMDFNMGLAHLLGFHQMLLHCSQSDWEGAASECYRYGLGDSPSNPAGRNRRTRDLFLQAAASKQG